MRMPFRLFSVFVLFASLLLISSCSSDDDNPTNSGMDNNNTLTAKVSGYIDNDFSAASVVYVVQDVGGMSQTVVTGYEGNAGSSENIMIQMINLELGPQTFELNGMGTTNLMYVHYTGGSASQLIASEGEIVITENTSSVIRGTFHAKLGTEGAGTLTEITNGSFYCEKK